MQTIDISLSRPAYRYSILLQPGLCADWKQEVLRRIPASRCLALVDANLARGGLTALPETADSAWHTLLVEPGEEQKNLAQYADLCEAALRFPLDRSTVVVAVGGGVTGDIAGFVCSTLLRGLRLVQIPTTLLAMVDSSVGGKNGVNSAAGKNLAGSFFQPELVLIDPMFLSTLPRREYLAGLAEVVKTAVLDSRDFFTELASAAPALLAGDHGVLTGVIGRCCRVKADFVMADERDTGRRQLLNLGHTFGHVLESLAGYNGSVIHGEAVAVGMVLAADFAVAGGRMAVADRDKIVSLLQALALPTAIADLGRAASTPPVWPALLAGGQGRAVLSLDKKAGGGRVNLVLPHAIGDCRFEKGFAADEVMAFFKANC